jgi:hypothetical protein
VGKGEDWLYSAGKLRAASQFSTPFPVLVFSVFILIDLSFCPWWLLSILSVTFHTNLLLPRRTIDIRLDALDRLIYSIHRFRMCVSPVKGLTADIFGTFRLLHALLSPGPRSHTSQKLIMTGCHPCTDLRRGTCVRAEAYIWTEPIQFWVWV